MVIWFEGPGHGLVWEHGVAVLSADVPLDAAQRLWAGLDAGGDLADFLTHLSLETGAGLVGLPAFAVALRTGDEWQLAARGPLAARVDDAGISGDGMSTWAERVVPAGSQVLVGEPDAAGAAAARPIRAGLVPAAALRFGEPATGDAGAASPADNVYPLPVPTAEPAPEDAPESPVDAAGPETMDAAVPMDAAEPAAEAGQGVPPTTTGRFAAMLRETREHPVEDAAVRDVPAPGAPAAPGAPGATRAPEIPPALAVPAPPATPVPPPAPAPATPLATWSASLPDEDADHAPQPTQDTWDDTPTVLALVCPAGHPSPPQRDLCGRCGAVLSGTPRRIPRPSLGRLVLANGTTLSLTAPALVGRHPRPERAGGAEEPVLVPIAQPHVSGTHLELRPAGWDILAVDLHSTNGTYLRRRGVAPLRLGADPEPLREGDVLDLGNGVQLRLEDLP